MGPLCVLCIQLRAYPAHLVVVRCRLCWAGQGACAVRYSRRKMRKGLLGRECGAWCGALRFSGLTITSMVMFVGITCVCFFHRFFTFQSPARIPNTKRQRHVKEGCSHCRDSCRDSCAPHATRHTVYAPSMRHLMTHQFINIFLSSHRAALTHTVTRPCFVALFCEARPVLTPLATTGADGMRRWRGVGACMIS